MADLVLLKQLVKDLDRAVIERMELWNANMDNFAGSRSIAGIHIRHVEY